ncbi:hypothetical protein HYW18_02610 [Candidatus Uhrbacteria bacterium]|nr:hypothetical protein [Candidatus Uhrbacteria bacterium]
MMERKIIRVGTSAAVILPQGMLKEAGVKIGDVAQVAISKPWKRAASTPKHPNILKIAEEVIEEYRPLLKKLAGA